MAAHDKKNEILKAASNCFAHYGYDKTTLDDIGRMVGLNKASLYYYYKSKESIFTDVIFFEFDEYMHNVLEEVKKVEGCKEKVLTYIAKRLEFIRSTVNLHKLTLDSMKNIRPLIYELYEKNMENEVRYLSQILECSMEKGEIAEGDANRIARSILTVTEAIKNRKVNNVDCNLSLDVNYTEVVNEVVYTVSLILDGLKAR